MDRVSHPTIFPILNNIEVSEDILKSWQNTADLLANIAQIPSALIMRTHAEEIEVFVSSRSKGNAYHPGERAKLNTGLYCETVMSTQKQLVSAKCLN